MPQSPGRRTPSGARWVAWTGLSLGAVGVVALWCWERPLGLSQGPLFFAVVALTALSAGAAVIALLRRVAADQRSGGSAAERSPAEGAASRRTPPEPLPGLLPELLLAFALLVCGGLAALFFLLPTNDDDPWIPWAASVLIFVALATRPIRGYLRVRGSRGGRTGPSADTGRR
ncbi:MULTISPECIES: hypothetical protein [unclassified Leucobacter]|nr:MULTISPECIES: hypothetical protein [unclassified Leucobacter]